MGYSVNAITSDCYDGTTCLINKFGITNENTLAQIEADITFAKASQLEANQIQGNFDFKHYKAIHKYLFSDLYDWAGKIRTINISKKGTNFVDCLEIEKIANMCFERLKKENYFKELNFESFVENIVDFYYTTNLLHPFREGNGRTQRIFITQLIRYCGYDIDFAEIDPDELMIATINSANGVNDMLKQIFKENIKNT